MMRGLRHVTIFALVTWLIAVTVAPALGATTIYIDEFGSNFVQWGSMNTLTCGGCWGGKTKWKYQSGSYYSYDAYGRWKSYTSSPQVPRYYWDVYIPNVSASYAAVEHFVTDGSDDNFYITVVQGNHKGRWVYLGWVQGIPGASYTRMTNRCIAGFWCGGLKVFWDHARYRY